MTGLRLIAIMAGLLLSASVEGQHVVGMVLDVETGLRIADAAVVLLDSDGAEYGSAVTSEAGMFVIAAEAGAYLLIVRHVAYQEIASEEFTVLEGTDRTVEVHLAPAPHLLDEVTVTETHPRAAVQGGYYRRRSLGIGRFISRDDIARRAPQFLTDMLEGVPGIRVRDGDFRLSRLAVWGECAPTIVLNNVVQRRRGQELGIRLDDLVRPQDVEGMEVFARGTGLPAQYGGRESPCGAILIWTKR